MSDATLARRVIGLVEKLQSFIPLLAYQAGLSGSSGGLSGWLINLSSWLKAVKYSSAVNYPLTGLS